MKITNLLGLPESLVEAVKNDPYDRGPADISVTGLINPARKRILEQRHADDITEDASNRLFALEGQVMHDILERSDKGQQHIITERRLFIKRHGWTISGAFDRHLIIDKRLEDYKRTSTYSIKEGPKPEWVAQTNIYRMMMIENGYSVDEIDIIVMLRDWQKAKAKHDPHYPQTQAIRLPIKVWPEIQTETYLTERLVEHGKAQHVLPDCSPEERWERPAIYRLMKQGNIRATSVHQSMDEADAAMEVAINKNPKAEYYIETTPPESKRCADYCSAAPFCDQWKNLQPGGAILATLSERRVVRAPVTQQRV